MFTVDDYDLLKKKIEENSKNRIFDCHLQFYEKNGIPDHIFAETFLKIDWISSLGYLELQFSSFGGNI